MKNQNDKKEEVKKIKEEKPKKIEKQKKQKIEGGFSIFVGNLNLKKKTKKKDFMTHFKDCGEITKIEIEKKKDVRFRLNNLCNLQNKDFYRKSDCSFYFNGFNKKSS